MILLGILAQLGEHLPYKQRVTGSSPVGPINSNAIYAGDVYKRQVWESRWLPDFIKIISD